MSGEPAQVQPSREIPSERQLPSRGLRAASRLPARRRGQGPRPDTCGGAAAVRSTRRDRRPRIEQTVATRTADTQRTARLLWAFLGGVNAHVAYLYPMQRALILALSIVGRIVTVGISGLLWVVTMGVHPRPHPPAPTQNAKQGEP